MSTSIPLSLISITPTTLLTVTSLSLLSTVLSKLPASMSSLKSTLAIFTVLLSSTAALFTMVLLNLINFILSLAGIFILAFSFIISNTLLLPTTLPSAGATSLGFIFSISSAFLSLSTFSISAIIILRSQNSSVMPSVISKATKHRVLH